MEVSYFLLFILALGLMAKTRVVVLASLFLIFLNELDLSPIIKFFSDQGIEIGLIFLLLAILASVMNNPLDWEQLQFTFLTKEGVIAVISGLLATKFNSMGLNLLSQSPQIIIGIILGSLVGIVFFNGIPVGPLMAAGIAALTLEFLGFLM
ncbi:MAG: DUF441 domain-containing protein [Halanaerobiaceae bacterium]